MLSVAIPVGVFRGVAFSCRKSQNKSKNQLSLSPFPSPPCSLQAIKPGKTRTGNKNKGRQHRCGQCHNAIAVRAQLWPCPFRYRSPPPPPSIRTHPPLPLPSEFSVFSDFPLWPFTGPHSCPACSWKLKHKSSGRLRSCT